MIIKEIGELDPETKFKFNENGNLYKVLCLNQKSVFYIRIFLQKINTNRSGYRREKKFTQIYSSPKSEKILII